MDNEQRMKELVESHLSWEKEMMEKHGWYAHMVGPSCECETCGEHDTEGDPDSPTLVNYHTHGLESFGHTDLQIVLPIVPNLAMAVFSTIVDNIKNGKSYKSGEVYYDILTNDMPVAFQSTSESEDHPVLRVILPDASRCITRETMEPQYAVQWDNLL